MKKQAEDWYKQIQESRDYAAKRFETLLVYIASGGLIISVGFVNDIIDITGKDLTFLKLSWIAFAFSILLNLASQLTSIQAMDYELDENSKTSDRWDKTTKYLNILAIIILFLGLLSFIFFISKNL